MLSGSQAGAERIYTRIYGRQAVDDAMRAQSNEEIIIKSVFKCKFVIISGTGRGRMGSGGGGGRSKVISFLIYAIV